MGDVVDFKKKENNNRPTIDEMFFLSMSQNSNGEYEVHMEISEAYTDFEVFEAMSAAIMKFAAEHGLMELEIIDDTIH